MDATSSLGRFSCSTYILSTASAAGAVLLSSFNEIASTIIINGLNLLKSIMPSNLLHFSRKEVTLVPPCLLET